MRTVSSIDTDRWTEDTMTIQVRTFVLQVVWQRRASAGFGNQVPRYQAAYRSTKYIYWRYASPAVLSHAYTRHLDKSIHEISIAERVVDGELLMRMEHPFFMPLSRRGAHRHT